ncbi:MAG TPA: lipase maturation factor family protein [Candidatus Acidoferrales bacterium]|nr:lipase maturation factor family protein [Candidatus Acidoferrales bacterium]
MERFVTVRSFLRILGCTYFVAFVSFGTQAMGLIGSHGILPLGDYLRAAREGAGLGASVAAWWDVPSVFWLNSSDAAVRAVWILGTVCAAAAACGLWQRRALAACLVLWLSVCSAGQDFLSFQWDVLLLEAGFLALFADESLVRIWLFRWLLFRLMIFSGLVKLLSGDPVWHNLTAMTYHYETQPLPTPLAWYLHQLPLGLQKVSTGFVFLAELAAPLLFFAPRRWRHLGGWITIGFQVLILLTGNYTFFNFLTIALAMFLFIEPRREERGASEPRLAASDPRLAASEPRLAASEPRLVVPSEPRPSGSGGVGAVSIALAGFVGVVTGLLFLELFSVPVPGGNEVLRMVAPLRIVNSYGLFAVMTTTRPEIVVEGSNDGETWQAYEFRYKAGDTMRPPPVVAPYQPRLDWQMWFAALGDYRQNRWFVNFMIRLLEGEPSVLRLLQSNPFPAAPPKYVRGELYLYHFTHWGERAWWRREDRGIYFPKASLQ